MTKRLQTFIGMALKMKEKLSFMIAYFVVESLHPLIDIIGSFQNIKIELDIEVYRTKTTKINKHDNQNFLWLCPLDLIIKLNSNTKGAYLQLTYFKTVLFNGDCGIFSQNVFVAMWGKADLRKGFQNVRKGIQNENWGQPCRDTHIECTV